jgi:alkyl hydroperoxide reductase subunit AhpF
VALLSESDQNALREAFLQLSRRVRLVFFTQTIGCETCVQTREILDELPPLSDKLVVEEVNLVLEKEKAAQFGIDRAPTIALVYDDPDADGAPKDSRIRFLGAPAGYEFASLVHAVLLVGGRASMLGAASLEKLAAVDKPVTMQVFTTPT